MSGLISATKTHRPRSGSAMVTKSTRLVHVLLLIIVTKTQLSHEKTASGKNSTSASQQQQHHHHHQQFEPFLGMSTDKHVTVETSQGRIRGRVLSFHGGKSRHTVGAFLGIPYAQPPLRELRFRVSQFGFRENPHVRETRILILSVAFV